MQEDLRKLRRMQVFMCAALATTLLIAAATLGFVIMMKWSGKKDPNVFFFPSFLFVVASVFS